VNQAWAIATRELRSFFRVPMGWVVMALYLLLAGYVFALGVLKPGGSASLREFFLVSQIFVLILTPAVSMRLVSEELRSGTLEQLMTSPASDGAVVVGKYLGGVLFILAMLAPTLLYVASLFGVSDPAPDPGPIAAGYLSLTLVAMMYLSVGLLVSTLTSNQTLAFIGTFLFLFLFQMLTSGSIAMPAAIAAALSHAALRPRLEDFARGIIDTSHVVFFLTISAWFLVLAYVSLQTRRWR
jgi:ABC-2 type transport system permease protein